MSIHINITEQASDNVNLYKFSMEITISTMATKTTMMMMVWYGVEEK